MADELRGSLENGTAAFVLAELVARVRGWSSEEKVALRHEMELIEKYDAEQIAREGLKDLFASVRTAAAGSSYFDRLVDLVGRWHAEKGVLESGADDTLAQEGLAGPLLNHIDWLLSPAAQRVVPFMRAVGRHDEGLVMVPYILPSEARSRDAFSAYFSGLAEAAGDAVDELLEAASEKDENATSIVLALWRMKPTPRRIAILTRLIANGTPEARSLEFLSYGAWPVDADLETLQPLLDALVAHAKKGASKSGLEAALALALRRHEKFDEERHRLAAILEHAVVELARADLGTMEEYHWQKACEHLMSAGRVSAVLRGAVAALMSEARWLADVPWDLFQKLAHAEPEEAWAALAPFLNFSDEGRRIMVAGRTRRLLKPFSVESVMAWVGESPDRGLVIAHLATAHEAPLNEYARAILIKYGPDSDHARVLAAAAHSSLGVIHSYRGFIEEQRTRAQEWRGDENAAVAAWGAKRYEEFDRELAEMEARRAATGTEEW